MRRNVWIGSQRSEAAMNWALPKDASAQTWTLIAIQISELIMT